MQEKKQVAVLMGGPSREHEISLKSGAHVIENLDKLKYNAIPVVISREGLWNIQDIQFSEEDALVELQKQNVDIAFLALHGEYGEDGTLQATLAKFQIPFTGSGAHASALGMNKAASGTLLASHNIQVPSFILCKKNTPLPQIRSEIESAELIYPLITKPLNSGSSIGVALAPNEEKLSVALSTTFAYSPFAIIQEYILGKEISVGILEHSSGIRALPPTHLIPRNSHFLDYDAKYDSEKTLEITPANLTKDTAAHVEETALKTHRALGCSGLSRTDMILDPEGQLFVLEINTLPGLTPQSLIPQQARAAGISFSMLLDQLIQNGLSRMA